MATQTFRPKFSALVEDAFDLLQVGQDGESLSADDVARAIKTYNLMMKSWQGLGMNLWTYQECFLFLNQGQTKYTVGTDAFTNEYEEDTVKVAALTGATQIDVNDPSLYQIDDNIGIFLDDDTLFYTTVTVAAVGDTITFADALPSDVAIDNVIIKYDPVISPIVREITNSAVLIDGDDRRIRMDEVDRFHYMTLPDMTTQGVPTTIHFARRATGLGQAHEVYVWPVPPDSIDKIKFSYERALYIVETQDDYIDCPEYWYAALVYNLAERMLTKFGASEGVASKIMADATKLLNTALAMENSTKRTEIVVNVTG